MSNLRTSVIVLCFNGLNEATRPCIESLYRNTPVDDFELVLVDNASTDGTADYLRQIERNHPNVIIQLNQVNKGFAGGNNDGLRLANGKYLVLLNNDTLVPQGWLNRLLLPLETDSKIGMAGPITNSAGNEQRVGIEDLVEKNYEQLSNCYISKNQNTWFETQRLGFYCVAMRRNVFDKVGLLDENFGIGMFEDDDYCIRALKSGYKLVVTEGCFVYHKGSVSFAKLRHADYHELFQRNKNYFISKHSAGWALSDIAFAYLNKFSYDLKEYSITRKTIDPEIERIMVRLDNFKHLLVQIREAEVDDRGHANSTTPLTIRQANWARIFSIVKREFIFGTMQQRLMFLRRAYNYVARAKWLQRLTKSRDLNILSELLSYQQERKVVIFPATVDFSYMTQRPQHLATAFSKAGYFVIYGTLNHSTDKVKHFEKISGSLFLVNQKYFQYLRQLFTKEDCIYYCMWPTNLIHTAYLPYTKLVYDYMDELELLGMDKALAEKNHEALLQRADVVTASSQILYDNIPAEYHHKTLLIPNAVSSEFVEKLQTCTHIAEDLAVLKADNKKIIGYYGAIAPWFDFDLIAYLARKNGNHEYVFIGPVFEVESKVKGLVAAHSNVHFYPMVNHEKLAEYLIGFDVAIIPFIKNRITDAVSPLKLFEYMSAGKPIITTDLNECRKYAGVYIAKSPEEFAAFIDNAESDWNEDLRTKQKKLASANSWNRRVSEILKTLSDNAKDGSLQVV